MAMMMEGPGKSGLGLGHHQPHPSTPSVASSLPPSPSAQQHQLSSASNHPPNPVYLVPRKVIHGFQPTPGSKRPRTPIERRYSTADGVSPLQSPNHPSARRSSNLCSLLLFRRLPSPHEGQSGEDPLFPPPTPCNSPGDQHPSILTYKMPCSGRSSTVNCPPTGHHSRIPTPESPAVLRKRELYSRPLENHHHHSRSF